MNNPVTPAMSDNFLCWAIPLMMLLIMVLLACCRPQHKTSSPYPHTRGEPADGPKFHLDMGDDHDDGIKYVNIMGAEHWGGNVHDDLVQSTGKK